jgi:hypothetical protein
MGSPPDTAERLLSSLESLERRLQERIASEAWPEVFQLLDREEAVVAGLLTALGESGGSPQRQASIQASLSRFLRLQTDTQETLSQGLIRTSSELGNLRRSRATLRANRRHYADTVDGQAPRFAAIG